MTGSHLSVPDDRDLTRLARRARRLGLFAALAEVYASLPETRCDGCARCCIESPGLFTVERLALLDLLAARSEAQRLQILQGAARELLFSWIEPERGCLFLEGKRCSIYEHRPLACRLFGVSSPTDPELAQQEQRGAAEEEADRLSWLGVEVPEATLTRVMVHCGRVRAKRGRLRQVDGDEVAERVAALDARLLPEEVVRQEYSFLSLPDGLGRDLFGTDGVEMLRLQLLRRVQRGKPVEELLAQVWEQVEARARSLLPRRGRGRAGCHSDSV